MTTMRIVAMRLSVAGVIGLVATVSPAAIANAAEPLAFDIEISLSAKAAAELKAKNESITALASYYGEPHKGAERHANEMGMIDLGTETIEQSGVAGPVHVSGHTVSAERLQWIQGPVKVNVNLFSSRKASDDNILNCDFIDGDVKAAVKAPVTLHCSLIAEGTETKIKP
ncbi:hypothetical protein CYK37_20750 [Mesorhizobium loti]|nr:hypothetical protein [Mesorhizobium loti]PLP57552.1 hypothetical protein CYK37_20750 [Mesorhizobium loti]